MHEDNPCDTNIQKILMTVMNRILKNNSKDAKGKVFEKKK